MPVRNVEDFIGDALGSALRQTLSDIEVLVIDDHCTDGTIPIVMNLAQSDSRVRVLPSSGDRLAAARNTGIEASRGQYIAILDGDDVWEPENLARQVSALERHAGVDLTFAAALWIDAAGNPLRRTVVRWNGALSYEQLLVEFFPVTASAMVARRTAVEAVGGFDVAQTSGGDHDLALCIALLREGNIWGLPEILLRYRRRPGQVTSDPGGRMLAWERMLEKHRGLAPAVVNRVRRRATARLQRALAAAAWESGKYRDARSLLAQALRGAPGDLLRDKRTWRTGAAVLSSWLPAAVRGPLERRARHA